MRGLFWKEEAEKRPWKYIEMIPEKLTEAVAKGAMFTTWTKFSWEPGNSNGEPIRYGDLVLDFDDKSNPQNALGDMRLLCLVHLPEIHDVDPNCIQYYASGSKGFHAVIPFWVFGSQDGHTHLPLIYKGLAGRFASDLNLKTLDMSLYCMGKGKMFRLPNIKRSIGTYKVPLTLDEVMRLDAKELFEFTKSPREIDSVSVEITPSPTLSGWYLMEMQRIEDLQTCVSEPLSASQFQQLKSKTAPCIRYILENNPEKTETFNFNRAVMLLVNYFQDIGVDHNQAYKACRNFIETYSQSETYSTPKARLDHFNYEWNYMLHSFGYFFSCERAHGLHMGPEAYQCLKCLQTPNTVEIVESTKADDQMDFPFQVMLGHAGYFANVYGEILEAPQHFLFMAYLTCLGAYFSPYLTVKSELRTQPRLYTVLVGESAIERKSTTLNKVAQEFKVAYPDFNTCWGIGSAEGLQRVLKKEENSALIIERIGTLLILDELKSFVSKCRIDNSVLLPIVNTLFEINLYETHTKNRDVIVEDAYLSLLAATTKETYERIYSPAFIQIGFPNRVFLVPGHAERRFSIPQQIAEEDKKAIHDGLVQIRNFVNTGIEFGFTEDAKAVYHDWYLNTEKSVHSKRLDTYSLRLMQLLALNSGKRTIDEEIIQHAIDLCDWQLEVRKIFDPIDADSTIAAMEQKIRRHLKKGRVSDRDLKRYTHAYRAGLWFYKTALTNLREAKEVAYDKPTGTYRLIE
jgi:hypothetical protein